ncbi:hypothetical protein TSUD_46730 [Trifolium subterraneum]|nr:hypothetical protein TSUD_46730 [Trifolium subterraneum]
MDSSSSHVSDFEDSSIYDDLSNGSAESTIGFYPPAVKGSFVTVSVRGKFKSELHDDWTLVDECGNEHMIKFNRSRNSPILTGGWDYLRTFYRLEEDHLILFEYNFDGKFDITVFKTPVEQFSFPLYHSESHKCRSKIFLLPLLSEEHVTSGEIPLTRDFAYYMFDYPRPKVIKEDNWVVKFAEGWLQCCRSHKWRAGDVLKLECKELFVNGAIYVSRIVT